ncbi:DUF1743 domain-containing protein [Candidatus Thorarchaeota archaeon]|nr:MAG: DUF1743 domain-containing protein [Candidatus Thorarchaeota archaeon]
MSRESIHLGFDDIDSPRGGCTTHFASLLVQQLSGFPIEWQDYPNLIRLNPGIPFRTRGNGAVALRFNTPTSIIEDIMTRIKEMVHEYVDETYSNTNPGVVLIKRRIPEEIKQFSNHALWKMIPIDLAKRLIAQFDFIHYTSGNGRGLIGAMAAIGNTLDNDHTYEYIAYRGLDESDKSRGVDIQSVIKMNTEMGERVFSNLGTSNRLLIEPHGPDPVLYGIRGETPQDVIAAAKYVKSKQNKDRWMVFRTNQATGEHLTYSVKIADIRPYMATIVKGFVRTRPKMIEGGHVIFSITDETSMVDCAAYEPTGNFRNIVMDLRKGDEVCVHASVRPKSRTHGLTLNIEGLEIVKLADDVLLLNPICPHCLKRMKSDGKNKGYKCVNCGFRDSNATKIETQVERKVSTGLYLPPLRAQRHLTRPESRLNKYNKGVPEVLADIWHEP